MSRRRLCIVYSVALSANQTHACVCVCEHRQAHVRDDGPGDDDISGRCPGDVSGGCPVKNDSRDVRDDCTVDRMLIVTTSVHHNDATSTSSPCRPPAPATADQINSVCDGAGRVSSSANHTAPDSQVPPSSRPIPIRNRVGNSCQPVERSPDAERQRWRLADQRRPESSPAARRGGPSQDRGTGGCGSDGVRTRRAPAVTRANTAGEYLLQVSLFVLSRIADDLFCFVLLAGTRHSAHSHLWLWN